MAKNLLVEMPEETHAAFKKYCIDKCATMRGVVLSHIEKLLEDSKREQDKQDK